MPLFATNLLLRAMYPVTYGGGGAGIVLQDQVSQVGAAGSGLTLDLTALDGAYTIQENDVLIALACEGQIIATPWSATITGGTGGGTVTSIAQVEANDSKDVKLWAGYYVCTGGETQITFAGSGNNGAQHQHLRVYVFSGIDTTTPMDVTATTQSTINGSRITPAAITPTTANAEIIVIGANSADVGDSIAFINPGDYDSWSAVNGAGSLREGSLGVGFYTWSSGTFTPSIWSTAATAVDEACAAISIALRPAAGGGGGGPIAILQTPQTAVGAGAGTTSTASITLGATSADREIWCITSMTNGSASQNPATGVTVDGNAMTKVASADMGGAGSFFLESTLWRYADAGALGTGAVNFIATYGANQSGTGFVVFTTDVQAGTVADTYTASGTSGSATPGSITAAANGLAVYVATQRNSSAWNNTDFETVGSFDYLTNEFLYYGVSDDTVAGSITIADPSTTGTVETVLLGVALNP